MERGEMEDLERGGESVTKGRDRFNGWMDMELRPKLFDTLWMGGVFWT
jgi:hypothetical protein